MIESKKDYLFYKEADKIISGRDTKSAAKRLKEFFLPDHIGKFLYLLRTFEYYSNCVPGIAGKIMMAYYNYKFNKISLQLGFTIPKNVFGPGLLIPHYGTIVINPNAKVGANCVVHTCVCIAGSDQKVIGDNAYLSTGVIISGKIVLKDNVTCSANSLINKSIDSDNVLVGGTPAKILKERQAWYIEDGEDFKNNVRKINLLWEKMYGKK